jgi:hypothetical protein
MIRMTAPPATERSARSTLGRLTAPNPLTFNTIAVNGLIAHTSRASGNVAEQAV